MSPLLRIQGRIGQRTLLLTTAAVPLTGWLVHAVTRPAHRVGGPARGRGQDRRR
jgi:cytochrome b561